METACNRGDQEQHIVIHRNSVWGREEGHCRREGGSVRVAVHDQVILQVEALLRSCYNQDFFFSALQFRSRWDFSVYIY